MLHIKVLGIIAEYNPFHYGHINHIKEAKKITNADFVIAVISGPFTQSGNISVMDKYKKAETSIKYGADLVIELPQIYSISSANYFSYFAIKLLDSLNIVDFICFGSECNDIKLIKSVANKIYINDEVFWNNLKKEDKNISFAKARENVLKDILNENELSIIKNSNDILGIEYVKALYDLNSALVPYTIKRNEKYMSATNIRDYLEDNNLEKIKLQVPDETYEYLENINIISNENIFNLIRYKILTYDTSTLSNIKDITEGLENKLKKEIIECTSYKDFINSLKSKRYQMSKIKRILINILLDITKNDFNYAINNNILYAHILKTNDNGKNLISEISKSSNITLITSANKTNNLNDDIKKYFSIDIKAQNIYEITSKSKMNKDYTNKI